jgi:MFS family permease
VLNFAQFAPVLLLAPWGGSLADRVNRKVLLVTTQTAATVLSGTLAVLAFTGLAGVEVVIGFAAALGILLAVSQPAQLALVASLVPRENVPQAVALNAVTFNIARVVGPMGAAAVIAWQGVPFAFAVNSCSYLVLACGILAVHPAPQTRISRARIRDGVGLLLRRPSLVLYLLVVASVSFTADPVNTEAPALAHAFGRSSAWAGTIIAAFGLGAVIAAFVFVSKMASSRARMALTLGAMGTGMVAFAATPWLPLGYVFLAVAGCGYLASNSSATARLQLSIEEHERGRIMALWTIAFLGVRPLASLIDGALASTFGVRVAVVVLALPTLAGAAWAASGTAARKVAVD